MNILFDLLLLLPSLSTLIYSSSSSTKHTMFKLRTSLDIHSEEVNSRIFLRQKLSGFMFTIWKILRHHYAFVYWWKVQYYPKATLVNMNIFPVDRDRLTVTFFETWLVIMGPSSLKMTWLM